MTRTLVLAALLVAAPASADEPPPVTVRASVVPEHATIGARVRYEVTVDAPAGIDLVVAQPNEKIGEFDIVDFGSDAPAPTKDGRMAFHRWWQLVGWSTGAHTLASPPVQLRAADGTLTAVPGAEITVTIDSLLAQAKDASDIRDITPPDPIPVDWRPILAGAGVVVAVALVAMLAWWLRRRRRRATPKPPALPAHVVARAALDALRARGVLPERESLKAYYSALSDIVRRYLEDRFGVRAPEMTTEEFLAASARDGRLAVAHRRLLAEFLAECDLVKFARHLPTIADAERAFEAARRFVDDTAVPEAA